ncbi:hypothetical protein XU18_2656 [Perkinsela sp. CCAP 1560/4]|nr:hypothetical protein XU18_4669 [Perkinsela sp. CCAP 1560/4]KNH06452.1 hypothetical protein XU18_2656 [Perkinsela sp. CCAP 1560/4]|eukprot:KNH03999.1 hypothetical protein XU18_4669 [Perkinsela sp. CCAP 1560/4]
MQSYGGLFPSSTAHLVPTDILCLAALQCVERSTLACLSDRHALRDALAGSHRILRAVLRYVRDLEMTALHGLTAFFQLLAENMQSIDDRFQSFAKSCCAIWDSFLFDEIIRVCGTFQLLCESTERYLSSGNHVTPVVESSQQPNAKINQTAQADTIHQIDSSFGHLVERYILRPMREYSTTIPTKLFHHESIIRVLLHSTHQKLSSGSIRGATENMRSLFRFLSYKSYGVWWVVAQYPLAQIAYALGNVRQCMHILVELDAQTAPAYLLTHAHAQLAMLSFYHDILMDWMGGEMLHSAPEVYGDLVPFEFLLGPKVHRWMAPREASQSRLSSPMDTTADQSQAYLAHAHVHSFFSERLLHPSVALHEIIFSVRHHHDERILFPAVNNICLDRQIVSPSSALSTEGKLYLWCFLLRSAVEDRQFGSERLRQCSKMSVMRAIFPQAAPGEPLECIRVVDPLCSATLLYCTAVLLLDIGCPDGAVICLVGAIRRLHSMVIFHAEDVLFQISARSLLSALVMERGQAEYAKDILAKACAMGVNFSLRAKYMRALTAQMEAMNHVDSACQVSQAMIPSGGLLGAHRLVWSMNTDPNKAAWGTPVKSTQCKAFLSQWTSDEIFHAAEESIEGLFIACINVFANSP